MKKPFTFTITGMPRAKGRPRMTRRGRVFTPMATHEAETIIAQQYIAQGGTKFEGPIYLEVDFHGQSSVITVAESYLPLSKLRGDVDNYLKLVMDGLNGVAWDDDKQVVIIYAAKIDE
jgi:Holliday junction resolvase RusA-like endonuclease